MTLPKKNNRILVLTGMHRSGTSLLANWLLSSGFNMGDHLVSPGIGNPLGHFEDWDFVHFHEDIFQMNQIDFLNINIDVNTIKISDFYSAKAEHLIRFKHTLRRQWGWKDPRTCLFLNFWNSKLNNEKYIFIFRHPQSVFCSLYDRELSFFKGSRIYPLRKLNLRANKAKRLALFRKAYIKYNDAILKFIDRLPENKYVLFELNTFLHKNKAIYAFLKDEWGCTLKQNAFHEIYNSKMLNFNVQQSELDDELKDIYQRLRIIEKDCINKIELGN